MHVYFVHLREQVTCIAKLRKNIPFVVTLHRVQYFNGVLCQIWDQVKKKV